MNVWITRQFSVSNVLSKLYSSILINKVCLITHYKLNNMQYGFLPDRGCTYQLFTFWMTIDINTGEKYWITRVNNNNISKNKLLHKAAAQIDHQYLIYWKCVAPTGHNLGQFLIYLKFQLCNVKYPDTNQSL